MSEPVSISPYTLSTRIPLNRRSSRREVEGVLISSGGGYGCLQPWPELGDLPLDAQVKRLAEGRPTNLGLQALRCCRIDAAARREGRNLFEGLGVPPSHFTAVASSPGEMEAAVKSAVRMRFAKVKFKAGGDVQVEIGRFRSLEGLGGEGWLRIDFNNLLDEPGFLRWADGIGEATRASIDFVEDPFPYDPDAWRRCARETGIALALDRGMAADGAAAVQVCKPALHPPCDWEGERRVVTSYMEHPLGQVYAALCAAEVARADVRFAADTHGLATHLLFEPSAFSERIGSGDGGQIVPPEGVGIGFGDLLDDLKWNTITP